MTVLALNNLLKSILLRAGADNPDGDAADIIMSVCGLSRAAMIAYADRSVSDGQAECAAMMARRRAEGEPIQYVIGSWTFMRRTYQVGTGVLIPRDDTEVVTRAALALIKGIDSPTVVDLCSGSGIIAVTLTAERPDAAVCAVEKSDLALPYLRHNAEMNNTPLRIIHADLQDCANDFADGTLDLIVSNPPYIRTREIPTLQREVQYEPVMALDGGESGYDFYRMILSLWTPKLKRGGAIALELGEGQYHTVAAMLAEHGYQDIRALDDIQNIKRAVTAVRCKEK